MEPKAPSPSGGPSPEQLGPMLPTPEVTGDVSPDTKVEQAPTPAAPEVDRPAGETAAQSGPIIPVSNLPQPISPPVAQPTTDGDDTHNAAVVQDAPDLANDVDVIEKEWVDKAKRIVTESSDDPHKQNHQVSVLKADYMKKRYGKEIKLPKRDSKKA